MSTTALESWLFFDDLQTPFQKAIALAEMIHDADIEDDEFHRLEGFGMERIFKGWAKEGRSDDEILRMGFDCFNGLYAQFKK